MTWGNTRSAADPDTRAEAPLDLAMIDSLTEAVTVSDDPQVLDAGCGAGRMSRYLAERGYLVQGADLSSRMVAVARRNHPDLVFTVSSLTEPPTHRLPVSLLWDQSPARLRSSASSPDLERVIGMVDSGPGSLPRLGRLPRHPMFVQDPLARRHADRRDVAGAGEVVAQLPGVGQETGLPRRRGLHRAMTRSSRE